ncbi:MAG: phosphoketolase, partial [Bacilli bacterium]
LPKLKIRVVNVIDLMCLESNNKHPHGLTDKEYDNLFTKDKPIIFAFHGYPSLIHQLVYNRNNKNIHVFGYDEEGTITTPFDMRVLNKIDRFHLVINALKYLNIKGKNEVISYCEDMLKKHSIYIKKYGIDMKEIRDWEYISK